MTDKPFAYGFLTGGALVIAAGLLLDDPLTGIIGCCLAATSCLYLLGTE